MIGKTYNVAPLLYFFYRFLYLEVNVNRAALDNGPRGDFFQTFLEFPKLHNKCVLLQQF